MKAPPQNVFMYVVNAFFSFYLKWVHFESVRDHWDSRVF